MSGASDDLRIEGRAQELSGDLDRAERLYRASLDLAWTPQAQFDLADLYLTRGRSDEAIGLARDLLEREGGSGQASWLLGLCLLEAERASEALPLLQFAATSQDVPTQSVWLLDLGVCLFDLGRYGESRTALLHAVDLDDSDPRVYFNLALIADREGDMGSAADLYRKVLSIDPDYHEASDNLRALKMADGRGATIRDDG